MCKFKAERLIKDILQRLHCRFICSKIEDGIIIIRYLDAWGNTRKDCFPYRYMTEDDIENMVINGVY